MSQQSFSEARKKIKYEAFQELFTSTAAQALEVEDSSLFHGYRLLAIDGSTMILPNSPELRKKFGESTPCAGTVYGRMSIIMDVLNEMTLDGALEPYSIGEREMAVAGVKRVSAYKTGKCLFLMDRGYWSPELFATILESGHDFLVRVPNDVTFEVKAGLEEIHIQHNGKKYTLRCKRFLLKSGEIEILVTSMSQAELSDEAMMELYALRWGIETKYNELKNTLKIDTLTSKTYLTVMQDFYATMTLSNLVAFAGYMAQEQINENQNGKNNKYAYKPNKNVLVSTLKDNMIAAVASESPMERKRHLTIIENTIAARPVPIRPGRSAERPGRTKAKKKKSLRSVL